MATATQVQKNLQAAMREALRIQDRFVAEPLFAKTGRGYLKSDGMSTLQRIKSNLQRRPAKSSDWHQLNPHFATQRPGRFAQRVQGD